MEKFLYLIHIDANHVMIGPPGLQHNIKIVWSILYMFSSVNIMPPAKIPFDTFFFGPELMTSQPEVTTFWGRLGSFWWQKHFLEKKERAQMLFQFLMSSLGSMLHPWRILQNVFSLFHFYELLVYGKS